MHVYLGLSIITRFKFSTTFYVNRTKLSGHIGRDRTHQTDAVIVQTEDLSDKQWKGDISTKFYDKQDDFDFNIENVHFWMAMSSYYILLCKYFWVKSFC